MKLKCNDGKVRRFRVAIGDGQYLSNGQRADGYHEAACLECGELFGCHDTHILKPEFKNHTTCKIKVVIKTKKE